MNQPQPSELEDHFLTLQSPSEGNHTDRGSKFLAFAHPVQNEQEAQFVLQTIKKQHPKARHYCTALRLFSNGTLERFNDDGEPSGSAGRPMMGQLIKNNLTNVFLVVVRYFGGTKLGIPGLIEAYKSSAAQAISNGTIIEKQIMVIIKLTMAYEDFPAFLNFCIQNSIPAFEQSFEDKAILRIGFKRSSAHEDLFQALHQFTKRDFGDLDGYATYLGMEIEFQINEVIV